MKGNNWKVWFGFALGITIAWLCNLSVSVDAQSLSSLLPKDAIAPIQITNLKAIAANLDGFIPQKLRESESPMGRDRAIIGEDQRVPLTSREYPWSTVGKIVMLSKDKEYSCTGTLISKSLVLTNAHCVYEKDKLFPRIFFLPNLINGRLRTRNDVAVVTKVGSGTNSPDEHPQSDWAILELNKPLGEKYGFLKWRSVPLSVLQQYKNKLAVAGYSGDYPDPKVYTELTAGESYTAGVHLECSVLDESDGMLVHDCDTNPGASGSALIVKIDGTYQIVGLHAGGERDRSSGLGVANYAVRIGQIEAELNKEN